MPRIDAIEGCAGSGVSQECGEVSLGSLIVARRLFVGGRMGSMKERCGGEGAGEQCCQQDSAESKSDLAKILRHCRAAAKRAQAAAVWQRPVVEESSAIAVRRKRQDQF
jgi:hypothetical protein